MIPFTRLRSHPKSALQQTPAGVVQTPCTQGVLTQKNLHNSPCCVTSSCVVGHVAIWRQSAALWDDGPSGTAGPLGADEHCVFVLTTQVRLATPPSLKAHFVVGPCRQNLSLFILSPPPLLLFNVTERASRQSQLAGSADPSDEPLNRTCFGPLSRRFLPGSPPGFLIAAGPTTEMWPSTLWPRQPGQRRLQPLHLDCVTLMLSQTSFISQLYGSG